MNMKELLPLTKVHSYLKALFPQVLYHIQGLNKIKNLYWICDDLLCLKIVETKCIKQI